MMQQKIECTEQEFTSKLTQLDDKIALELAEIKKDVVPMTKFDIDDELEIKTPQISDESEESSSVDSSIESVAGQEQVVVETESDKSSRKPQIVTRRVTEGIGENKVIKLIQEKLKKFPDKGILAKYIKLV